MSQAELSQAKSCAIKSTYSRIEPKKPLVNYRPTDIEKLRNDNPDIALLLSQVEATQKCVLNYTQASVYIHLYEYFGFPIASILLISGYCTKKNYDNVKTAYLVSVAMSMFEDNIIEPCEVEHEITRLEKLECFKNSVMSELGLNHKITKNEKSFIDRWNTLGVSVELISRAYELSTDKCGKPSLKYTDTVLESWASKHITTIAEADADIAEHEEINAKKYMKTKKEKVEKEKSYDLDEFEKFLETYELPTGK